jgi:ribose 5-phosphate isomerase B
MIATCVALVRDPAPKGAASGATAEAAAVGDRVTITVGIAADHGGYELKCLILEALKAQRYRVVDFGAEELDPEDDYPDFVVPLARAVAAGTVDRGVAICGSGVGATIAANKVRGARACLIHDGFSAHQGVEDDNMNIICLGGRVLDYDRAWEYTRSFLQAEFSGAERHRRRLLKVAALEEE